MPKENPQDTYAQLQDLMRVDFDLIAAKRNKELTHHKQLLRAFVLSHFDKPHQVAADICQYIEDGKMPNTPGFIYSIRRMLQIGNLNKEGLVQIIETIKNKYQIENSVE